MYRIPESVPQISFILAWTWLEFEQDIELKQLHPKRLTQESKEHLCSLDWGQIRFLALSPHILICVVSGAHGSQSVSLTLTCCNSHFWTTWELCMEKWSCWSWITPLGLKHCTGSTMLCFKMCLHCRPSGCYSTSIQLLHARYNHNNEQTSLTLQHEFPTVLFFRTFLSYFQVFPLNKLSASFCIECITFVLHNREHKKCFMKVMLGEKNTDCAASVCPSSISPLCTILQSHQLSFVFCLQAVSLSLPCWFHL
jgi:hypothetical protein